MGKRNDFDIARFNEYREGNRLEAKKAKGGLPGSLWEGAQMLKGGISDPRNKALMKMFNMVGIGERAGSGVPGILAVWDSQGWVAPTVEEQYGPDRTILTLSFEEKQAEKASGKSKRKKQAEKASGNGQAAKTIENKKQILAYIDENGSAGSLELAELVQLSQPRVRVLLSELADEGEIKPVGVGRSRVYVVKERR